MYHGKHEKKPAVKATTISKVIMLLLAMALVCSMSISGVLAWLTGQTGLLVNTFTYGDVWITLSETTTTPDDDPEDNCIPNDYLMLPGKAITKNPVVTVANGSEYCWLFVTMEESDNFEHYLVYNMAEGWVPLPEHDGVYYRELADEEAMEEAVQGLAVIQDHTVYVQDSVTRMDLQMLHERYETGDAFYPNLTVTAWAVQRDGFDEPEEAWLTAIETVGLEVEQNEATEEA